MRPKSRRLVRTTYLQKVTNEVLGYPCFGFFFTTEVLHHMIELFPVIHRLLLESSATIAPRLFLYGEPGTLHHFGISKCLLLGVDSRSGVVQTLAVILCGLPTLAC